MRTNIGQRRQSIFIPTGWLLPSGQAAEPMAPHPVRIDSFQLDRQPVTNAEFRVFVIDTGYLSVAERDSGSIGPGSFVFRGRPGRPSTADWRWWWRWTSGASWRAPEGPGSSVHGRENHPVVHLAHEDAREFAAWAGKRLPTELEWEYACSAGRRPAGPPRGGRAGGPRANIWAGHLPADRMGPYGGPRTAAIGRHPANEWGLVDMVGNVWEWTATRFTAEDGPADASDSSLCCSISGCGPDAELPAELCAVSDRGPDHVIKGGSH